MPHPFGLHNYEQNLPSFLNPDFQRPMANGSGVIKKYTPTYKYHLHFLKGSQ